MGKCGSVGGWWVVVSIFAWGISADYVVRLLAVFRWEVGEREWWWRTTVVPVFDRGLYALEQAFTSSTYQRFVPAIYNNKGFSPV